MRNPEDRPGPLVTCKGNTGRSPVLTGELVPVDWHGLPVQVTKGPDRSSEPLIGGDVKNNQPWPPSTAPYQGHPTEIYPDLLWLPGPFRASYLLGYGTRSLSYKH